MIDLHCHSSFSDGAFSPAVLLDKALDAGVRCLALTDHDTLGGLKPLHAAAYNKPIQIVNGVELSVRWKKYDIHVIGLGVSLDDVSLNALIEQQNQSRITRALSISTCLETYGIDDAYAKACHHAGHLRVGRPHFARVLVDEGLAVDLQAAFKTYLGRGRGAFVQTPWVDLVSAVACIVAAGGQAVIAHPLKYKLTRSKLHELMASFKEAGGCAIEVVSGEMMVTQIQELAGVCLRFGLLASSGSDYHGESQSRVGLGRQRALPTLCTPIWTNWPLDQGLT